MIFSFGLLVSFLGIADWSLVWRNGAGKTKTSFQDSGIMAGIDFMNSICLINGNQTNFIQENKSIQAAIISRVQELNGIHNK